MAGGARGNIKGTILDSQDYLNNGKQMCFDGLGLTWVPEREARITLWRTLNMELICWHRK